MVHCPADFGISYSGTFYDGSRTLAKFVYGASGCQTVSITAGGKTQSTMVFGSASAAAPKLRGRHGRGPRGAHVDAGRAAVAGQPGRTEQVSYGRLPDSSRSNSPSLTPRTNASHSASVK